MRVLFAAVLLGAGVSNAWAATRTLTDDYSVAGYKTKAYYDLLSSNVNTMCPTSGDVRYRDTYGLYNFGSGNRSGAITISVSEGDLIIFEAHQNSSYSDAVNSVSSCTLNATVSTGSYWAYDVTGDATSLTINLTRAEYVSAILVMEVDDEAETADYTINYKDGETTVKTVSGTGVAVGTVVPVESSFFKDEVKYLKDGGEPSTLTVASGGSTLNVKVSEAPTYSYTVNATDGTNVLKVLASGSIYSGETVKVPFPRYFNVNGTLYEKEPVSSEHRQDVVISSDDQVTNFVYSATSIKNVVFYSEGEEIEGATATSAGSNMATRSSNAQCGYVGSDLTLINLPAGSYKATTVIYSNSSGGATLHFQYGDTPYDETVSGANNWSTQTEDFTISSASDFKWLISGGSKNGLDFIYIQQTAVPASIGSDGYATFSSTYPLDFTGVTEATAYIATDKSGDNIKMQSVTGTVAAGTGLVLKSTSGSSASFTIPTAASGTYYNTTTDPKNYLFAINSNYNLKAATDGEVNYVLSVQDEKVVWAPIGATDAPVTAGHAALWLPAEVAAQARTLSMVFDDDLTGINSVKSDATLNNGAVYNLRGQRVAQPTKGLYIVNGKKVIVK